MLAFQKTEARMHYLETRCGPSQVGEESRTRAAQRRLCRATFSRAALKRPLLGFAYSPQRRLCYNGKNKDATKDIARMKAEDESMTKV